MENMVRGLGKNAKKISESTSLVCGEVASIQKALHVPYTSFKNSKSQKINEQQTQGQLNAPDEFDDETAEPTKKIRDFFAQTSPPACKEHGIQTEPVKFEDAH